VGLNGDSDNDEVVTFDSGGNLTREVFTSRESGRDAVEIAMARDDAVVTRRDA